MPSHASKVFSVYHRQTHCARRSGSDTQPLAGSGQEGVGPIRRLRRNKTSLPDLERAAYGALLPPLARRPKGLSFPDLTRMGTGKCLSDGNIAKQAHDCATKGDWQARVGWPARFVKVSAPAPKNPAKPHLLGCGKSGTVMRMRELATGRDVAVKKFLSDTPGCADAAKSATREFEIAHDLRCRHAILPEEMAVDAAGKKAFLVFPYVAGTTLAKAPMMSEQRARQVLLDMVTAVADLVAQGVTHNDIHGNNIMLDAEHTYLIDFGFACENDSDLLWRQDMRMLCNTLLRFWPIPSTRETRSFFRWFGNRVEIGDAERIAQDVLEHPFLIACKAQKAA